MPYSPLGRGFLTGAIQKKEDLDPSDWRLSTPRFEEDAWEHNRQMAATVKEIADEIGATGAQVALVWVLQQDETMIPIPGTKRVKYLEDNAGAAEVTLSADHLARLDGFRPVGERYAPMGMEYVNL